MKEKLILTRFNSRAKLEKACKQAGVNAEGAREILIGRLMSLPYSIVKDIIV